ncbi:hypothetical protein Q7C36_020331 [Tachysurus vachellii]|uniref:Uncharacterized protein n=1 Tax=Tachysurus vachellii TaxID=175792 RepID=A0AA88LTM1_TACVA|nr:hypothetical protein Q7C36_020331 [Tachysurus vachellii]
MAGPRFLTRNVNRCALIGSVTARSHGIGWRNGGGPEARAPSSSVALFLLYYCERPEEQCNIKRALAGRSQTSESSMLPWPFTSVCCDTLERGMWKCSEGPEGEGEEEEGRGAPVRSRALTV